MLPIKVSIECHKNRSRKTETVPLRNQQIHSDETLPGVSLFPTLPEPKHINRQGYDFMLGMAAVILVVSSCQNFSVLASLSLFQNLSKINVLTTMA